MKKHFLMHMRRMVGFAAVVLLSSTVHAEGTKTTYTFTLTRAAEQTTVTRCPIHPNVVAKNLGCDNLMSGLNDNSVKFYAVQGTTGRYYSMMTLSPYGHYFAATGNAVNSTSRSAVLTSQFTDGSGFSVNTINGRVQQGDTFTFSQAFVHAATNDTVAYVFRLTISDHESVVSDEPAFVHRADIIDDWLAIPYMQQNDQTPHYENFLQVNAGDRVTMGLRVREADDRVVFSVKNPSGKSVRSQGATDFELTAVEPTDGGCYELTARYTLASTGKRVTQTYLLFLDVQTHPGELFDWESETPRWSYDFRSEYPELPQPTKTFKFTQHNGNPANMVEGDWWAVYWGDNLNPEVDGNNKHAMTNMVKKYDEDFAYIRNEMGWPPDIAARQGYKSFIYVFGSGINRDNTSQTEAGGYQGYTNPDGMGGYPCVYASYYPVSRFRDDANSRYSDGEYQREAMIHEGIHATFADMEGVKKSAWFHEAGNTWLQGAMGAKRYGNPQVSGWLGVGNLICPFMPIECYSGWLQDGSFGGPAAEGVNMYNGSGQQVCTWRNLIGGVQYGETFPIFLGLNVGYGSVPWIWRYCRDYVLKGIAQGNSAAGVQGIGDEGMRQLILHYRAKLATMDFKESSEGMRNLLNGSFGTVVKPEWEPYWINVAPFSLTPYQVLSQNDADGWYAPDPITNPGWSGGNILPIHVTGNSCEVIFRPEDKQMRAQLCYRTKDGRTYYSQPVMCGPMTLQWSATDAPANGVVFAVVCNTDYIYTGDEQRKHKWDYRLKMGEGAVGPASTTIKWYFYEQSLRDTNFETGIENVVADPSAARATDSGTSFRLLTSVLRAGSQVQIDLNGVEGRDVVAHLVGASGILIDMQTVSDTGTIQLPASLPRGLYFLSLRHKGNIQTFKVFAE